MRSIRWLTPAPVALAWLVVTVTSCESRARNAPDAGAASATAPDAAAPQSAMSRVQTVFVILMENKTFGEVKGNPDAAYFNRELMPHASIAGRYRGPRRGTVHPSEPNYIWMEAGDDFGITDDDDPAIHHLPDTDHLVTQLDKAGISWRAYQEGIPGDSCPLVRIGEYWPKHNPMIFFDDVTGGNDPKSARCIEHVRPVLKTSVSGSQGDLQSDLETGKVARYNFITPDSCNDMHTTCPPRNNRILQGDDWLARWVPRIMASDAYRHDGALFVTWDEAESTEQCPSADCPIGMLVLSPLAKGGGYTSAMPYDHSSYLRTMQDIFRVRPYLRAAARATALDDLFQP
jgi:phospholipase C